MINLWVFYVVANSPEFVRCNLYKNVRLLEKAILIPLPDPTLNLTSQDQKQTTL